MDMGCLLLFPVDTNLPYLYTLVSDPHKTNYEWIYPLLDTTNITNNSQVASGLIILFT